MPIVAMRALIETMLSSCALWVPTFSQSQHSAYAAPITNFICFRTEYHLVSYLYTIFQSLRSISFSLVGQSFINFSIRGMRYSFNLSSSSSLKGGVLMDLYSGLPVLHLFSFLSHFTISAVHVHKENGCFSCEPKKQREPKRINTEIQR